ncbi:MAG: dTDP-4-dehydrorhamnose reductase [Acidimicrobiia bacterium]|nr:dTDP-4-dehydrorhamnose reductase [Acidimicrobiia bacterium]
MIVVTGSGGQLGSAFRRHLTDDAVYLDRSVVDLQERGAAGAAIRDIEPTVVINCAAYTAVDRAERDEKTAERVNAWAVQELALACRDVGARLVTFSTDYVFDGEKEGSYVESDSTNPLNAYGRTKQLAESLVLAADPTALIVRTSWLLSGTHHNFLTKMVGLIAQQTVTVVDDQFGHPTFAGDLVEASLAAIQAEATGLLHLTNTGTTTWFELARLIATAAGLDENRVLPCATSEFPAVALRPRNSVLGSDRRELLGIDELPHFGETLERTLSQIER